MKNFRLYRLILITILLLLITAPGAAQKPAPESERRGLRFGPELQTNSFGAPALVKTQKRAETEAQQSSNPSTPQVRLPMSKIVFDSLRNLDNYDIWLANDDGSEAYRVSGHPANDVQPRLNRTGDRILFVSDRGDIPDIFTMNIDGSELQKLTAYTVSNQRPSWSPDASKIAFQSYRDGNWEIYVMNADGSEETRLTNTPGGFSGEPSWSPDGSKIAYTSYQNGGWRIWVMNTDGSGQTQLSQQAYSSNPYWSKDGAYIAYNADTAEINGNEIYTMAADGSNQTFVINSGSIYHDNLVSGWAPDGAIVFTYVNYIYENNTWYWVDARIFAHGQGALFPNEYYDWNADWQTQDHEKPQASINTLPPVSPAQIALSWQASDPGGSGVRRMYIQVREGLNGVWTIFQPMDQNNIFYTGVGGKTYYFRVQAVDFGGNYSDWTEPAVTTVESLPPITTLKVLPQYSPSRFLVEWSGTDPGGSGLERVVIEVRDGPNGSWNNWSGWVYGGGSREFYGPSGHTYYFRIYGVDAAQNVEELHNPDGYDTSTTTYTFMVSGKTVDHTGKPLAGVTVHTTPAPLLPEVTSQTDGSFAAPITYTGSTLSANWFKSGYGQVPETKYEYKPPSQAVQLVIMPPADNVVTNPGLEFTQTINAPWQGSGVIQPIISQARLTGASSIQLGTKNIFEFQPLTSVNRQASQMLVDASGVTHLAWLNDSPINVYYSQKPLSGVWSNPVIIQTNAPPTSTDNFQASIGPDGSFYLSWRSAGGVSRIRRNPAGIWSPTFTFPPYYTLFSDFIGDSGGTGHFAWQPDAKVIYYTQVRPNGQWLEPVQVVIAGNPELDGVQLVIDSNNIPHIFWKNYITHHLLHSYRLSDGTWSVGEILKQFPSGCSAEIKALPDQIGGIYIFYIFQNCFDDNSQRLNSAIMQYRSSAGVLGAEEIVLPFEIAFSGSQTWLKLGNDNTIHMLIRHASTLKYLFRSPSGVWSTMESFNINIAKNPHSIRLEVDPANNVHISWNEANYSELSSYYALKDSGGWRKFGLLTSNGSNVVIHSLSINHENRAVISTFLPGPLPYSNWLNMGILNIPQSNAPTILDQIIQLPAEMPNPILSFAYQLQDANQSNGAHFDVLASQGGVTTTLFTTSQNTSGWTHQWADLSDYAGQEIKLSFQLFLKQGVVEAQAFLDDVTIGSTPTDVWVTSAPDAALPGSQVVYALSYGNQGGLPAENVVITHTVSADMTFISASLPVTPTGTTLTWNLGTLPGNSSGVIYITVALPARLKPGANLLGRLDISTQTSEPETANNTAQTRVFIGHQIFLPMIQRK